jgi:hypothetical protein
VHICEDREHCGISDHTPEGWLIMGGSAPRRAGHLPVETTSFVDRRGEQSAGRELLTRTRLVTLTGPGGVGKTRLAARIAARAERTFPDGVRFVHLAELRDPEPVPLAVADALGLHDHSAGPPSDALVAHVRDRRVLVVLDNCEHLLGACAHLAAPAAPPRATSNGSSTSSASTREHRSRPG